MHQNLKDIYLFLLDFLLGFVAAFLILIFMDSLDELKCLTWMKFMSSLSTSKW